LARSYQLKIPYGSHERESYTAATQIVYSYHQESGFPGYRQFKETVVMGVVLETKLHKTTW